MGTFHTPCAPGARPENGQPTALPPPPLPVVDQPIFLALDEAMRRPAGGHRPRRRKARWRRRLRCWVRQKRLGLCVALLIVCIGLAYTLVLVADGSRRYGPAYYEPKDLERWQWVHRSPR